MKGRKGLQQGNLLQFLFRKLMLHPLHTFDAVRMKKSYFGYTDILPFFPFADFLFF